MSAVSDFARLPTRQKVMTFGIIGLVLGLLYWQFVYKGLVADVEAAEGENASLQQQNAKLEKEIPEYEKLRARVTTLQRIIEENQKALPTEAELPAFFETLNRKVLESGVEVIRSKQGKEEKVESFVKVPIDYEIQGTYVQIKKFFASLLPKKKKPGEQDSVVPGDDSVPERERIVSIENLSLTNPVVRNREIRLTAKFVASTFRADETDTPTFPPPASTAPATKPMAPASTPKGAKQRTEDALDKADKKDRDAAGVDEAKTPSATGVQRMKEGK